MNLIFVSPCFCTDGKGFKRGQMLAAFSEIVRQLVLFAIAKFAPSHGSLIRGSHENGGRFTSAKGIGRGGHFASHSDFLHRTQSCFTLSLRTRAVP